MKEEKAPLEITIGARKFVGSSESLTMDRDSYILGNLRLAGSVELLEDLNAGRPPREELAHDLLTRILLSGQSNKILAGCLCEEGKAWSRKTADENAEYFDRVSDPDQKVALRQALVSVIVGFFRQVVADPGLETRELEAADGAPRKAPQSRRRSQ